MIFPRGHHLIGQVDANVANNCFGVLEQAMWCAHPAHMGFAEFIALSRKLCVKALRHLEKIAFLQQELAA